MAAGQSVYAATRVYGQPDFTTSTAGTGASRLVDPRALVTDAAGGVYVADTDDHRVLYYTAGSAVATRVYGQPDFSTYDNNHGGVSATSLSLVEGVALDQAGNLYIADSANNRVLYYPAGSTVATRVYGQPTFSSNLADYPNGPGGAASATSSYYPVGLALDSNGGLYVAEDFNSRVLYYPAGSTTATRVYGQQGSFASHGSNTGGVSADSLNDPHGIALDGAGDLYVADTENNRVLYYSSGSTTATRVYGQPDYNTVDPDHGGISATSLSRPAGVAVDSNNNIYISDDSRILYYLAGSTAATRVYGQPDFSSRTNNNGGLSATSLFNTYGQVHLAGDGTLYAGDSNNNRVLAYGTSASGGIVPWHPHYSVTLSAGLSASVDLADGHVDMHVADMALPGRGPGLSVAHIWDSTRAAAGTTTAAGQGWNTDLTATLVGAPGSTVTYTDASGAAWQFTPNGSGYHTPPGLPWQLATPGGSPAYTLTNVLSGEVLSFDSTGHEMADADSYGNSDALSPVGAQPTSYRASSGRAIALSYTAAGYLQDAESPQWIASGGGQTAPGTKGQHVAYTYGSAATPTCQAASQLCSITWAANVAGQAGTASFGYNAANQLVGVTTPGGHQWAIAYTNGQVTITSPTEVATGAHQDTTTITYGAGTATVVEGALQDGAPGPSPISTAYSLDGSGQALRVQDAAGTDVYTYDEDHGVLTHQDADGNTTTTTPTYVGANNGLGTGNGSVGLPHTVLLPGIKEYTLANPVQQNLLTYTYDANNDLIEAQNQDSGGIVAYTYDNSGGHPHHRVLTTVQAYVYHSSCGAQARQAVATATPTPVPGLVPFGGVRPQGCTQFEGWRGTINTYDPGTGDLLSTAYGQGVQVGDTVIGAPPPTATPAAAAPTYTRGYSYDPASGDPRSVSGNSAAGAVITRYLTDGDGDPTTITSPNGNPTTYLYDHWGRLAQETQPAVALYTGSTASPIWKRAYSGDGWLAKITDPAGKSTGYTYDPLGRKVKATDQDNDTTTWTYSATTLTGTKDPVGRVTSYSPDATGRLASVTGPAGDATHDPGQLLTAYQYDAVGNATQVAVGPAAGTPIRSDAYRYDAQDNRVEQDTSGAGLSSALTTLSAPHPDGMVAQEQAPNGDLTTYSYDQADEPTQTTFQSAGTATPASEQTYYDSWGNVSSSTGWAGQDQVLSLDAAGRPSQVTDYPTATGVPDTIDTTSGYDLDGNLLTRSVTERLAGPTGTGTPTTATYSYAATPNALDWTTQATDNGLTTNYGYDALGRLRTLSLPLPAPFATGTGTSTATPTVTGTVLAAVSYGVDNAGMLRSIAEGPGGTATPVATALFVPNRDGELASAQLPGGVKVANGIDGAGRTITVKITNAAATGTNTPTPVAQFDYRYDVTGRTTGETDTVAGTAVAIASVTPDAAGRLRSATVGGVARTWTYDGVGDLLTPTIGGRAGAYSYESGDANELASAVLPTGTATATIAVALGGYDANGNPGTVGTGAGVPSYLQYDTRGRPAALFNTDGSQAILSYDAAGRRTGLAWTQAGTGAQPGYGLGYRYRGGQLAQLTVQATPVGASTPTPRECAASDQAGCTETFVYRQDGAPYELIYAAAKDNLPQRYWYETDGKGSVVALTNSAGQVVDRYAYDIWGVPTTIVEQVPQPLLYRGYVYDRELQGPGEPSGWYWLSVRSYDPTIGRFIQPDPSEQEGTRSYVYAGDDPLDASDPSGLASGAGPCLNLGAFSVGSCGASGGDNGIYYSTTQQQQLHTLELAQERLIEDVYQLTVGPYVDAVGTLADPNSSGQDKLLAGITLGSLALGPEGEAADEVVVAEEVVARKPLTEGEVGRFGDLDSRGVTHDDLTPHHIPQAAQRFTSRDDGAAVVMSTAQHSLTRDFKGRGRILLQAEQGLPFRTVLARSLWDYRRIEPQRSRTVIPAIIQYYRDNFPRLIDPSEEP